MEFQHVLRRIGQATTLLVLAALERVAELAANAAAKPRLGFDFEPLAVDLAEVGEIGVSGVRVEPLSQQTVHPITIQGGRQPGGWRQMMFQAELDRLDLFRAQPGIQDVDICARLPEMKCRGFTLSLIHI